MQKEIEIKFDLLNKSEVIDFLNKNAEFIKEDNQLDIYYDLPHRTFLENKDNVHEWLRLRKGSKGCSLNYKDWGDNTTISCEEHEEKVSDIENIQSIFDKIGIKEMIKVDKNRKVWNYKNYTICIDSVKELGDFIEIEKIQDHDENLEEITKEFYMIKEELGVQSTAENKTGYPYDIMKNKGLI